MIEGLRMRPWLQDEAKHNPDGVMYLTDCQLCMQHNPRALRQEMGCGYEPPPPPSIKVDPWTPPVDLTGGNRGYKGPPPQFCAGYTTKLPEVVEIERARKHWLLGELRSFCGDEPPTDVLIAGIELLDMTTASARNFRASAPKDPES